MLRHRSYRTVGCRRSKLVMQLSSNTRVAKATGDVQRHERCLGGWMKRSKVSRLDYSFLGCVFMIHRSTGSDPIATRQH